MDSGAGSKPPPSPSPSPKRRSRADREVTTAAAAAGAAGAEGGGFTKYIQPRTLEKSSLISTPIIQKMCKSVVRVSGDETPAGVFCTSALSTPSSSSECDIAYRPNPLPSQPPRSQKIKPKQKSKINKRWKQNSGLLQVYVPHFFFSFAVNYDWIDSLKLLMPLMNGSCSLLCGFFFLREEQRSGGKGRGGVNKRKRKKSWIHTRKEEEVGWVGGGERTRPCFCGKTKNKPLHMHKKINVKPWRSRLWQ